MEYKIQKFTDLVAWQKAHQLALQIYQLTKDFPADERFGLVNQMRRAAVSISSNIAEGYGRGTAKDKVHFYLMAQGSLYEIESQLLIALDLGYTKKKTETIDTIMHVDKLLKGLMRAAPSRHT
jgi:four helix bundle protein